MCRNLENIRCNFAIAFVRKTFRYWQIVAQKCRVPQVIYIIRLEHINLRFQPYRFQVSGVSKLELRDLGIKELRNSNI